MKYHCKKAIVAKGGLYICKYTGIKEWLSNTLFFRANHSLFYEVSIRNAMRVLLGGGARLSLTETIQIKFHGPPRHGP